MLEHLVPLADRLRDDSYVQSAIAAVHLNGDDAAAAIRALDAAAQGAAGRTTAYWQLRAGAEEAVGRPDAALKAAVRCAETLTGEWAYLGRLRGVLERLDPDRRTSAWDKADAFSYEERDHVRLERAGDLEGAEKALKVRAKERPEWFLGILVEFYIRHQRFGEGEDVARQGLQLCPPGNDFHRWYQSILALVLAHQGQWDAAVDHACLALQASHGWAMGPNPPGTSCRYTRTLP